MKFFRSLLVVLVMGLASCLSVVDTPLEKTTFDMGWQATHYIRPYRIKLYDIDDGVLSFDVIGAVELSNPTIDTMSFDVMCAFKKDHQIIKMRKIKDYRVPPKSNRLVKMIYATRDYSVHGYMAECKVRMYRLR